MSVPPTPLNRLRQLWSEGRPAFGAIATIPWMLEGRLAQLRLMGLGR